MAKRMILMVVQIFGFQLLGSVTNIEQCVGVELTESVLATFPVCDTSTRQNCVLGFVKGVVAGDAICFLVPMSDDLRQEEFGVTNVSQITSAMSSEFHDFVVASGFSNHVVCAYSETVTNDLFDVAIHLSSCKGDVCKTNEAHLAIRQIDDSWRIVGWEIEE